LSPPKSGTVVANDWKMKSIPLCGDHISNHVLNYSRPDLEILWIVFKFNFIDVQISLKVLINIKKIL